MTALGKAPDMLRNKPDTTSSFLHFSKVQCTASIRESVVDWPGCPLKWLAGRRWCVSDRCTTSSDTIDNKVLAIVLLRVMGQ